MPASLLYDFENSNVITNSGTVMPDRRALAELALELTLLGLSNDSGSNGNSLFSSGNNSNHTTPPLSSGGHAMLHQFEHDSRFGAKRSQNTTECVPVPSSEHVAEIVGRQGCKIKALRAKTNTYIKTPVRGEEPVFVVTGRKEDVSAAKREILSAAEHFSQIRAQRKNNPGNMGPAPNAHLPGHITIQVRVPYRVVGLVVGPKGATIKRIQQQTNTYIITPSRDKDPVFEVTGLPEDVETARKEIEAHIAIRTGGIIDSTTGSSGTPEESASDFSNSPLMSSFDNPFASNVYNNNFNNKSADLFAFPSNIGSSTNSRQVSTSSANTLISKDSFTSNGKFGEMYSALFTSGSSSNSGKNTSTGSYDTDEGIGDSPTYDIMSGNGGGLNSMWNELSNSTAHSSNCQGDFTSGSLGSRLNGISSTSLEYHRRSSSLESNIDSSNSSSSLVSSSAPAELSII